MKTQEDYPAPEKLWHINTGSLLCILHSQAWQQTHKAVHTVVVLAYMINRKDTETCSVAGQLCSYKTMRH